MRERQLTPEAASALRLLYTQPDTVRAMPRNVARELHRAGLVTWCDGGPELTARGVNRVQREGS